MMLNPVTLEQLKQQVAELPLHEQLKLVVYISERLSAMPLAILKEDEQDQMQRERLGQIDAWIAECDQVADL